MSSRILVQLATAKRTNVSGQLMVDHPVKRRRVEEPAEAAQAQTREAGQPTSRPRSGPAWRLNFAMEAQIIARPWPFS